MMYDTDILIWIQRGNSEAARQVENDENRQLSIQSYMELLQGARHRTEQQFARDFISQFSFTILPLTENIGHRALIYVEEYALSDGMRAADAIVAATAVEANLKLLSGNARHLRPVKELQLRVFRP